MQKVICDTCSNDLSVTGNCIGYRVKLCSEQIPCNDGAVTAMMIYPQFNNALHFCGIECLVWGCIEMYTVQNIREKIQEGISSQKICLKYSNEYYRLLGLMYDNKYSKITGTEADVIIDDMINRS